MADNTTFVQFATGQESNLPETKTAGKILFSIDTVGEGNDQEHRGYIYFDKDNQTRIKMSEHAKSAQKDVNDKDITTYLASAKLDVNNNMAFLSGAGDIISSIPGAPVEYIVGEQKQATNLWIGKTKDTTLYSGKVIAYKLPYAGTSTAATLNLTLNGGQGSASGAKKVFRQGSSTTTTHYPVGTIILMTYDATADSGNGAWQIADYTVTNSNTIPSAYCTTAAGTAAKAADCTGYELLPNSYLHFIITNNNTATGAITMNVNKKGAKPVYINGKLTGTNEANNSELKAGSYIAFYDGTNYYFNTQGYIERAKKDASGQDIANTYINSISITGNDTKDLNDATITAGSKGFYAYINGNGDRTRAELPIASASVAGIITNTAQTLKGTKTFSTGVTVSTANSFNYSGIQTEQTAGAHPIWFSKKGTNGTPVVDASYLNYNPGTQTLTVANLAGKASQAIADGGGNTIVDTYISGITSDATNHKIVVTKPTTDSNDVSLPYVLQSGDTMTGTLIISNSNANGAATIQLQSTVSGKVHTANFIQGYPLTASGMTLVSQADGNYVIGSGESANAIYSNDINQVKTAESETLHLAADGSVYIYANCQTMAQKKEWNFKIDGTLSTPGGATSTANLLGTASRAVADSNGNTITDTYISNIAVNQTDNHKITITKPNTDSSDVSLPFVLLSGDTMTGDLTISKANPEITLNATSGQPGLTFFRSGTAASWRIKIISGRFVVQCNYDEQVTDWFEAFSLDYSNGQSVLRNNLVVGYTVGDNNTITVGTGTVKAANFDGLATKATGDSAGADIRSTYLSSLTLNGNKLESYNGKGDKVNDINLSSVVNNNNAATATKFASAQSITLTGDTTGTASSQAGWSITTKTDRLSYVGDQRTVATQPNDYNNKFIFQGLKRNDAIGNPNTTNTYSYVLGLRGWVDSSGGQAHEFAFNDTGIFRRSGSTTSWGSWSKLLDSGNYNSYAPTLTGTGATGKWGISISGNADTATTATSATSATSATTATKFSSTRTIALTGDVTGSTTGDGSSGWSINTIVTDNSHEHTRDTIVPFQRKVYSNVIATAKSGGAANGHDNCAFYFIKVLPSSYNDTWYIKYRIIATTAGVSAANGSGFQESIVEIYGVRNALMAYRVWNNISNGSYRSYYYNMAYYATSTGISNNYGHALGVSLLYAYNPTTASNKRTITVEILDQERCSVSLLDTPVLYANWTGTGTTNYVTQAAYDGVTQGVTESGDRNDPNYYHRQQYAIRTTSTALYRYQICLSKIDKSLLPINTSNNVVATNKTLTTESFDPFGDIYYWNSTSTGNANANVGDGALYDQLLCDLRYSFNIGGYDVASTLVARKPLYLVAKIQLDGTAKLNTTTPLTQTLPTSSDGNIYIYLGQVYPDTNPYRLYLTMNHPIYMYTNGGIQQYTEHSRTSEGLIGLNTYWEPQHTTYDRPANINVNFHDNKLRYFIASTGAISDSNGKPPKDLRVLHMAWDNTGYDVQLGASGAQDLYIRSANNAGTFTEWKAFLNELNFNSYAPKLDGTGATGDWGINITGNAATATAAKSMNNLGAINGTDHAVALKTYFDANKSSITRNKPISFWSNVSGNGSLLMGYFLSGYDSSPYGGFFVAHYNNAYYVGIQNGTYTQQKIVTSTNYTDYTVTKTGGGATGDWSISITGNAATATKFASAQSITLTGDTTGTASSQAGWSIATTTKHISSSGRLTSANVDNSTTDYKNKITYFLSSSTMTEGKPPCDGGIINFAWDSSKWGAQLAINIDSNPHLYLRGGSNTEWDSNWSTILDSSNYNTYAPKKDGTGASGNWGINITGNAATAISLTPTQLTNQNLDDIKTVLKTNYYYGAGSNNVINNPMNSSTTPNTNTGLQFGMYTYASAGGHVAQELSGYGTAENHGKWIRWFAGTSWSPWEKFITSSGGTFTGAVTGTSFAASDYIAANINNSNSTGGISLWGNNPAVYGIAMRSTGTASGQGGHHGYVTGNWAIYSYMNGSVSDPADVGNAINRGWIFKNVQATTNVASISGGGHAVFNGSVTIGGNETNTSGCRVEYNSTLDTVNFVFV